MTEPYEAMARDLHREVMRHFGWRPDKALHGVPDHWTEHADAVEADAGFLGDCDDFAMTCAELLRRRLPKADHDKIRVVFCQYGGDEYHLICVLDETWALDNRHRTALPVMTLGYRLISYMEAGRPRTWMVLPKG